MMQSRAEWMGLLARSNPPMVAQAWESLGLSPPFKWLRAPELGAVMVRGQAGGSGKPFNLGEMAVTRCALQLVDEQPTVVGHAYVQGRNKAHAEQAALVDALMQTPHANQVDRMVLQPLANALALQVAEQKEKAGATKVDFFTLVRGEDE